MALPVGWSLVATVMAPLPLGFPSRLYGCPSSGSCGSPLVLTLLPPLVALNVAKTPVCARPPPRPRCLDSNSSLQSVESPRRSPRLVSSTASPVSSTIIPVVLAVLIWSLCSFWIHQLPHCNCPQGWSNRKKYLVVRRENPPADPGTHQLRKARH